MMKWKITDWQRDVVLVKWWVCSFNKWSRIKETQRLSTDENQGNRPGGCFVRWDKWEKYISKDDKNSKIAREKVRIFQKVAIESCAALASWSERKGGFGARKESKNWKLENTAKRICACQVRKFVNAKSSEVRQKINVWGEKRGP